MLDTLVVQSHKGPYKAVFNNVLLSQINTLLEGEPHFLVDQQVAELYEAVLQPVLSHPNTLIIKAVEDNKSIEKIIPIIEQLVKHNIRRGQLLTAIGGGIIQDITCFIASTLLRGLPWRFVPTTLLAQADSCIGSKSSINLGDTKNILGTFNPPQQIIICTEFLNTLEDKDIHSGVGEIIKVHAIEGANAFDQLSADFDKLFSDASMLLHYIHAALNIKKRFIEQDEFDQGIRNIFNYGHSFGHAIESATHYLVPHGIAVTMGMDIANHIAVARGLLNEESYHRMHPMLKKNYLAYSQAAVVVEDLLSALMKDKKNTSTMLGLVFPVGEKAVIQRQLVKPDEQFRLQCEQALASLKQ